MIGLNDVVQWLISTIPEVSVWTIGVIDRDSPEVVGVYDRPNGPNQPYAIDRLETYSIKSVTLLVHWGRSATVCEQTAQLIYSKLRNAPKEVFMGSKSCWIIADRAPVLLSRDANGYFEAVIDFNIYIRR